ncbi:MAG: hypothetical protein SPL08_03365 [Pseudomonadota bacterium]|nr:hypothetical protein [Pseudomonadota bacterium]
MKIKTNKYPTWIWQAGLTLFGFIMFFLIFSMGLNWHIKLDKTIYQYIGKVLLESQVLYQDVFDHKGPLVYFWHALGALFSPKNGIWVLDFILFTTTLIYAFNLSARFTIKPLAFGVTIFLFSTLNFPDGIGNTESLCLLPLFVCLDKFCTYMTGKSPKKKDGFLLGLCLSVLLLIKPTHLIMPATLGAYAFCIGWHRRDWATLKTLFSPAIFSFIGIILLTLSYFAYHHALTDFWETYILFNLSYTQKDASLANQKQTILFFISQQAIFIPLIGSAFLLFKKPPLIKTIIFPILFAFIMTFGVIVAPGRKYLHYLILILPLSQLLLTLTLASFNCFWKIFCMTVMGILLTYNLYGFLKFHTLDKILFTQNQRIFAAVLQKEVPPNTPFLDLTRSFSQLFLLSDRNSASKYPFTHFVVKKIAKELEEKGLPTYMVTIPSEIQPDMWTFYTRVYQNDFYCLLKRKSPH